MVKYNRLNVKLSDAQLKKLKTAVKKKTGATLMNEFNRMSLKMLDGNYLPHELLLMTRQRARLGNAFNNNTSTDLTLSKALKISKIIPFGGFLESLLSKLVGPLMKVTILKNVLAPLGITAAASAIGAEIQKKIHGSGTTTLIISKKELNDIMKIVQALEDSNIFLKGFTKTIKNETKEQKGGFVSMLLGTLGGSVRKHFIRKRKCKSWFWSSFFEILQKRKRNWKSWLWKRMGFLVPPHPLTSFEIQKYYENESRFNGAYSRNNLP